MIADEPQEDEVKLLLEEMDRVVYRFRVRSVSQAGVDIETSEEALICWHVDSPIRELGFVPDPFMSTDSTGWRYDGAGGAG